MTGQPAPADREANRHGSVTGAAAYGWSFAFRSLSSCSASRGVSKFGSVAIRILNAALANYCGGTLASFVVLFSWDQESPPFDDPSVHPLKCEETSESLCFQRIRWAADEPK